MRGFVVTSALVVAAVAGLVAQQATFRAGTQFVSLPTTVTDAGGRLVPNLEKDQFTVFDNGKPQMITVFENGVTPFTVVVMLDFSASMTENLDRVKNAAEQFLLRMLPQDKGQVGAFSDRIQFSGTFTSDRDDLIGALGDLQYGNPTRLYDAIDQSIDMLQDVDGRKVVLVLTDGDDTDSKVGFGHIMDRATQKEVMIYAIGLESVFFDGQRMVRSRPDHNLRKMAEETGGGYFELKKTDDLSPTFTRVAEELHSLYTLGFNPPDLDGKEHKVEVRMQMPGLTARTRKSYVASAERLSK
ncbi:MAG TPA: VWA domain-containing protein [Vicinamibacterales bacterium]|nr:VWA domain-containing protein [Vicinamibacterales bacterium]